MRIRTNWLLIGIYKLLAINRHIIYIGKLIYTAINCQYMGRGNGTDTTAQSATTSSKSIRTTIPAFIVQKLAINEGDVLSWDIDKEGKNWIAILKKRN